jgi:hypothetical protein
MADFNFATPRIAVGAAMRTADDVRQAVKEGITLVLDCWQEEDFSALWSTTRVRVVRCPTLDDGTTKKPAWFASGVVPALSVLVMPNAGKVLAHCCEGRNRAPSMVYAILRSPWASTPPPRWRRSASAAPAWGSVTRLTQSSP